MSHVTRDGHVSHVLVLGRSCDGHMSHVTVIHESCDGHVSHVMAMCGIM